jgi:hypothetical protein
VKPCARPKPKYDEERNLFVCSECDYSLGLLIYDIAGGQYWWRHRDRGKMLMADDQ